jgi:hypothetical protein
MCAVTTFFKTVLASGIVGKRRLKTQETDSIVQKDRQWSSTITVATGSFLGTIITTKALKWAGVGSALLSVVRFARCSHSS